MPVRPLTTDDADDLFALRQHALQDAPLAFLSSPAADPTTALAATREQLTRGPDDMVFGAYADHLVGMLGMFRARHPKAAHKVNLWGMYVDPDARRRGLARALLAAALDHARRLDGITQAHISVSDAAPTAGRLYESVGFRTWGVEPAAISHNGTTVDERHMVLAL